MHAWQGRKFDTCCGPRFLRARSTPAAGALTPQNVEAISRMLIAAFSHHQAGRLDDAERLYRQILMRNPTHPDALHLMAIIMRARGEPTLAVEYAERAIIAKPRFAEAKNTLGVALKELGRVTSALQEFEKALQINPTYVEAWYNAANSLQMLGLPTAAAKYYRRAVSISPEFKDARGNLLMAMNYSPDFTPEEVFAAHREFAPLVRPEITHQNTPKPDRRLKIGYVSPDFRRHPVAYFFEPILRCHQRSLFEVYCYDSNGLADEMTGKIRSQADHWRDIAGVTATHAAELVAADQIDVLIDLANYSRGNRLDVFARKPAPIQATWLGIPQTTGLSSVDYRITDELRDPVGLTESIHTEELLRLPGSDIAFDADPTWPPINALPASANGYITFASFNNLSKVNPTVISVWAQILLVTPGARLLIAASGDGNDEISTAVRARFSSLGIGYERLTFVGRQNLDAFLRLHHQVDVALDPFPCTGVTTTLHSLWMGVPVITLAGDAPISRGGAGILGRLELDELVAHTQGQYIAIAARVAKDHKYLAALRHSLRDRIAASTFSDPKTVTHNLESAYRQIWQRWCVAAKQAAAPNRKMPDGVGRTA